MSMRWKGAVIPNPPTVVGPVSGEGGSASGAWTLQTQMQYAGVNGWPKPILPKQLWSWGYNNIGQLGLGNTTNYSSPMQVGALTNWSSVSCGYAHTVSIKTDGTLWSWGYNGLGQLGLGNVTNYSSPKQVGALTSWTKLFKGSTTQSTLAIKSS